MNKELVIAHLQRLAADTKIAALDAAGPMTPTEIKALVERIVKNADILKSLVGL